MTPGVSRSPRYRIRSLSLATGAVLLWVALVAATYHGWIHGTNHRDFYPRWAGARLALLEGRDLYSADTTRRMQLMLYGRALSPGEDPQAFAYPAVIVPLLLPFWAIPDVEIATAAWEATSVLLLIAALWLVRPDQSGQGRFPVGFAALLLLWYYPGLMIFQAQFTALPVIALALAWAAFRKRATDPRWDIGVGAALAIGLVKPEQIALPAALVLAVAVCRWRDQWRVPAAFAAAAGLLLLISVAINGWWFSRWIEAVVQYARYAPTNWTLGVAWAAHPLFAVALLVLVAVVLLRARWTVQSAITIGIPLGLLLLPQTLIWGLTLLIIPLVHAYRVGPRRWPLLIWLVGWLLVFGVGREGWWRVQSAVLPALTLILAVHTSRRLPRPFP